MNEVNLSWINQTYSDKFRTLSFIDILNQNDR